MTLFLCITLIRRKHFRLQSIIINWFVYFPGRIGCVRVILPSHSPLKVSAWVLVHAIFEASFFNSLLMASGAKHRFAAHSRQVPPCHPLLPTVRPWLGVTLAKLQFVVSCGANVRNYHWAQQYRPYYIRFLSLAHGGTAYECVFKDTQTNNRFMK